LKCEPWGNRAFRRRTFIADRFRR